MWDNFDPPGYSDGFDYNIELFRKGITHRKISSDGKQIISKALYNKITKAAKRKGADIRIAEGDYLEHIKQYGSAVTIGDVIYFTPDPTTSDVLEEVYHFYQNKAGLNAGYKTTQRKIMNEIDAQYYLLSVTEKYKIPKEEVELTKANLAYYEELKLKLIKSGEWDD